MILIETLVFFISSCLFMCPILLQWLASLSKDMTSLKKDVFKSNDPDVKAV